MKLYTFRHSPNPLKARLALAELGLEYEAVEVNLFEGEHRSEAFRAVNPHGKVPVLIDGELTLPESNAILCYLGETRGGARWPDTASGRAQALRWLFFDSFSLGNQCGTLWWTDVVSKATGRPGAAAALLEDATSDLERALDVIESELEGRDYLLGADLTLPDCAVVVGLSMLEGTRLDRPERWPRVHAYRERMQARPSWQAANGDAIHRFG